MFFFKTNIRRLKSDALRLHKPRLKCYRHVLHVGRSAIGGRLCHLISDATYSIPTGLLRGCVGFPSPMGSNIRLHRQHLGRIAARMRRISFTYGVEYPTSHTACRTDCCMEPSDFLHLRGRISDFTYSMSVGLLPGGVEFPSPMESNIRRHMP